MKTFQCAKQLDADNAFLTELKAKWAKEQSSSKESSKKLSYRKDPLRKPLKIKKFKDGF